MTDLRFEPEVNCWRVETADKFAVIVDGADYFRVLREALLKSERLVILVGWDFDFDIDMLPGESDAEGNAPDGFPNQVGPFLDALADRRKDLDIYLLKWSGGTFVSPGQMVQIGRLKMMSIDQVHLALDGCHPIGACHHQKIVVIDDALAFCGGIDVTDGRWDTRDHLSGDPRRGKEDEELPPWHDLTTMMSGPAAAALSELARARWERANNSAMDEDFAPGGNLWPQSVTPQFRRIEVAIARTEPPEHDRPAVNEIEQLYLDSIAAAKDSIYIESQYFCADSIFHAILERLRETGGPDVVVINPYAAHNMVEDQAMHVTRSRMMLELQAADHEDRFRMLYPVNDEGEPIYVHAKVEIVDDDFLRVGSSNIDRRSMGFDTECDIALIAKSQNDRDDVRMIRDDLLAEHLGQRPAKVARVIKRTGSLIAAIDELNGAAGGRGLRPIEPREETLFGRLLADTRFFDPRYRQSARARLGLTTRHLVMGVAVAGIGLYLLSRARAKAKRSR